MFILLSQRQRQQRRLTYDGERYYGQTSAYANDSFLLKARAQARERRKRRKTYRDATVPAYRSRLSLRVNRYHLTVNVRHTTSRALPTLQLGCTPARCQLLCEIESRVEVGTTTSDSVEYRVSSIERGARSEQGVWEVGRVRWKHAPCHASKRTPELRLLWQWWYSVPTFPRRQSSSRRGQARGPQHKRQWYVQR